MKVIVHYKCSYTILTNEWEQRKLLEFVQRESTFQLSSPDRPSVEYEDVVSEEGRLNKDIRQKEAQKSGILFNGTQVLYGKLRPYLHNWLNPDFTGVAVGDWWVLLPSGVEKSFLYRLVQTQPFDEIANQSSGSKMPRADWKLVSNTEFAIPSSAEEQKRTAETFDNIDNLITLHQRKPYIYRKEGFAMLSKIKTTDLFCEYYAQWIKVYKSGAIRRVTMDKYLLTQAWLEKLIPELPICELNRLTYQRLLNDYAETHEKQTTMDFHHQLKGAILDAVDDGLIERDPTRKAIIKGKTPRPKKTKYLNQFEVQKLLDDLELLSEINWDWFILLIAKTGMRFSEALAITPKDFDFQHQSLSINKTWDYKGNGGFLPTKNRSSNRKIQIDWQLIVQFSELIKNLPEDKPIFINRRVFNSTVNNSLERHCNNASIPVVSIHGLRHTHASLLLFAGVSIASVARRLGHSSITTTQKTYIHIIHELENKDIDLVMRSLSSLG